jgi:ankyrin repeat protein
MIELLHSLGADINSRNRENKTPLMDCCHARERYRGVTKIIELAIKTIDLMKLLILKMKKATHQFYTL